jgi:uncharacterized membrane protein
MVRGRSRGTGAVSTLLDLAVVCGIALTTYGAWLRPELQLGPGRILLGAAFVLLAPGYAVTAALFPRRESTLSRTGGRLAPGHLTGLERVVYAVGLSIVTVPLLALFLNFTQWGITSQSVLLALLSFILVATGMAAVRRLRVPPDERFRLPLGNAFSALTSTRPATAVIAVLFVLSLAVAGSALVTANSGQQLTEFYLLSQDEETGELVADDYPEAISPRGSAPIFVGIENREAGPTEYTVLAEFHRVNGTGDDRAVTTRWRTASYETQLGVGETNTTRLSVSPPEDGAGERLRLTLLLYTGSTPENPRIDDAYRTVHIWVDVPADGGAL